MHPLPVKSRSGGRWWRTGGKRQLQARGGKHHNRGGNGSEEVRSGGWNTMLVEMGKKDEGETVDLGF